MTTALVCGLGLVGRRAARQLVDGGHFDRILVTARKSRHAESVADILGEDASAVEWPPSNAALPSVDVIACALGSDHHTRIAKLAIEHAIPMVSAADGPDAIAGLRVLDDAAMRAGIPLVGGCGFAPGFADVLAVHAASLFDSIDDIRIARAGAAGPASIESVRDQRRGVATLFRAGKWQETARLEEQVWFPEPVSAADCQLVAGGGEYLAQHFGAGVAVTNCWAETKPSRWPRRNDDGLGAIRVEVWGTRNGHRDVVVYGAIDRVSSAAGAMLGRVTELLALGQHTAPPGVRGVAGNFDAEDLIRTLGERGLHAAVFEGAPIG